jgi:hypothetical protein
MRIRITLFAVCWSFAALFAAAQGHLQQSSVASEEARPAQPHSVSDDTQLASMRRQLEAQQAQIDRLQEALNRQEALMERTLLVLLSRGSAGTQAVVGTAEAFSPPVSTLQVASFVSQPTAPQGAGSATPGQQPGTPAQSVAPARPAEVPAPPAGIRFSGDFRLRADAQVRSATPVAGPVQNVRMRYRLRLNMDRELGPQFRFHMQLSTGPLNNPLSNEQDFAAMPTKGPFAISEAFVEYRPSQSIRMSAGQMIEVFEDASRFLWDDDITFRGFQQSWVAWSRSDRAPFKSLQLKAGEYILSNPNVVIVPPGSPFLAAGFQTGKKVRDSLLFHPGLMLKGDLGGKWSQTLTADIQIYRHPNQIQLASTAAGFPVLISNTAGIALSGPLAGTGNATTTPGGAIYSAPHYQVVRVGYRADGSSVRIGEKVMPFWIDIQAARNVGTSKLRDAVMASINLGAVRNAGNVRLLYQFTIKDANSMISQFTDDNLGSGSGVNIAAHAVRFDLGLTSFLQMQHLLFIQNQRRASNPTERLFVPLERGAGTTYRYRGQLAFVF